MPALNFTEEDWQRLERDPQAPWAGELKRPLVYLAVPNPPPLNKADVPLYSYWSNYPLEMPADEIVDRFEPVWAAIHFYGDAFPWGWLNFGPGIVAGFLGAQVNSVYEPSETVWFSPVRETRLANLGLNYDAANIWWQRVKELTTALVERLRGIRWIPGGGQPPPQEWLPLLKRIREGGKQCQVFVSPEGARTIVKNLGGRGFLFVIQPASDSGFQNPEEADAFLRTLAMEDISQ